MLQKADDGTNASPVLLFGHGNIVGGHVMLAWRLDAQVLMLSDGEV